jgi:hypothetical protein
MKCYFFYSKKCEKLNLTINEKGVNDVMINITLTPFLSDSDIFKKKILSKKFDHLLN